MSSSKKSHELFSKHFKLAFAAEEENQDEKEAFTNFQKCYEIDPKNREAKQKYLSYFKKNFERENNKKSQDELKLMGNALIQQQKFEEAIIAYTAAIDLDPSVEAAAAIYSNRSLCFYNTKKYQEAYDDGSMASILRPEWPRGWMRRAAAAIKIENYQDAHECYEKYFELDPDASTEDADAVKNKNLAKKELQKIDAEKQRKQAFVKKTKQELMSIDDEYSRSEEAFKILLINIRATKQPNFDICRLAIDCGADIDGDVGVPNVACKVGLLDLAIFRAIDPRVRNTKECKDIVYMLIDERVKRGLSISAFSLSSSCYWTDTAIPDAEIMAALFKAGKFDLNVQSSLEEPLPLHALVANKKWIENPQEETPLQVINCLHCLLNHEGLDVNAVRAGRDGFECTALMEAQHPEAAKLLIRHGADVNVSFVHPDSEQMKINPLSSAFQNPKNPFQAELVRVLVSAGARLIPDCNNGKSSGAMGILLTGEDNSSSRSTFPSEEVLDLAVQLNKKQGLELKTLPGLPSSSSAFGSINAEDHCWPFLHILVYGGAPVRLIEKMIALDPASIHQTAVLLDISHGKKAEAGCVELLLTARLFGRYRSVQHTVDVFRVLVRAGIDLNAERVWPTAPASIRTFSTITLMRLGSKEVDSLFNVVNEELGISFYHRHCKRPLPAGATRFADNASLTDDDDGYAGYGGANYANVMRTVDGMVASGRADPELAHYHNILTQLRGARQSERRAVDDWYDQHGVPQHEREYDDDYY